MQLMTTFIAFIIEGTRDGRRDTEDARRGRRGIILAKLSARFDINTEDAL